ncbi:MAG TPA: hypothetical protein PK760_01590 [Flavobacteriales bacterium]|nr:hypothetical protein [Flavobacteriales bacterium]
MKALLHLCLVLCVLASCDNKAPDPVKDDTPTFGKATVLADEDLRYLMEDEELAFNSIYTDAQVTVRYLPEAQLTKAMLADSVRCVFGAFKPGGEQEAYFRTRNMTVRAERICMEAIAVIVSENSALTTMTLARLKQLLGEDGAQARVLFESQESGVPRSIIDSLFSGDASGLKGASAVKTAEELVQRVSADPTAIGLISFARISDLDDERCRALRKGTRFLSIAAAEGAPAFPPDQGTLKDGSYPLRRPVLMCVVEGKSGLGTGFASFVAGPKGQRIILKQGLAPERVPARDIELVHP